MWLNDTSYNKKCLEGTDRNLPARNTLVQLLDLYTNSESNNANLYRQTDGRTDDVMMPVADHTMQKYDRLKTLPEHQRVKGDKRGKRERKRFGKTGMEG